MNRIYLDHAASTPVDEEVIEAMLPYFNEKYGNASSIHSFGQEAKRTLDDAREKIAKKINAEPSELVFTSGGTESNNFTTKGIAFANKDKGKHIVTTRIEHDCILSSCKWLETQGFEVTYLPVDEHGLVKLNNLEEAIRDDTILVSIIHGNNEVGTIEPIEELGKICREKCVYFHTDACQSFTKFPIDVKKQNLDLMTINSHKIYGPKGIGALYIKNGVKIDPLAHGGGHEFKMRSGTENIPGVVGFAKATEVTTEKDVEHMTKLRDMLIKGALGIEDSRLNGHPEKRLCNNANISFKYIEGESLILHLDAEGIAASTGSACSSKSLEPSHVLTALGLKPEVAHGSIRLSVGKENTVEEIERTLEVLKESVETLRKISPLKE